MCYFFHIQDSWIQEWGIGIMALLITVPGDSSTKYLHSSSTSLCCAVPAPEVLVAEERPFSPEDTMVPLNWKLRHPPPDTLDSFCLWTTVQIQELLYGWVPRGNWVLLLRSPVHPQILCVIFQLQSQAVTKLCLTGLMGTSCHPQTRLGYTAILASPPFGPAMLTQAFHSYSNCLHSVASLSGSQLRHFLHFDSVLFHSLSFSQPTGSSRLRSLLAGIPH